MDLKNKIVVITGGAGGIGSAIADVFLSKGVKSMVLLDINEHALKVVSENLNIKHGKNKVVTMQCDVTTDLEEISKNIFEEYKSVDVLVNCAGLLAHKNFKKIIDLNVTALIECTIIFYNHMRKDKGGNGGTIINLASQASYSDDAYFSVYKASKFAVLGFTRSKGNIEMYNKTKVRVIAICPGLTSTELLVFDKNNLDEDDREVYDDVVKTIWQSTDAVGTAAAEIFEKADSGTAWEIKDGKPAVEVLHVVKFAV